MTFEEAKKKNFKYDRFNLDVAITEELYYLELVPDFWANTIDYSDVSGAIWKATEPKAR